MVIRSNTGGDVCRVLKEERGLMGPLVERLGIDRPDLYHFISKSPLCIAARREGRSDLGERALENEQG